MIHFLETWIVKDLCSLLDNFSHEAYLADPLLQSKN